jgi:WbqC-like protein family
MTTVVISQPMLFPWPGFFEQLMLTDRFLFLDDVQFSKGSFTNRIQIKSAGKVKWLTISLKDSGSFKRINELAPAHEDWRSSQLQQLTQAYSEAPYAADALALAETVYAKESVCEVLIASIEEPAKYLNIASQQQRAKTSDIGINGTSSTRVLDLVCHCQGTRYLTGHGAAKYLDHESFEKQGIAVEYMDYSKTIWPQSGGEFTPYLSVLDLIANTGRYAANYLRPATTDWRSHLSKAQTR